MRRDLQQRMGERRRFNRKTNKHTRKRFPQKARMGLVCIVRGVLELHKCLDRKVNNSFLDRNLDSKCIY